MEKITGYISEIFRSIQGEGEYVGVMQVFMRMAGCSRHCAYCDTQNDLEENSACCFYEAGGTSRLSNPILPETAFSLVSRLLADSANVHSLSITGGEPLEQPAFLTEFLEIFRTGSLPVYLETNGLELSSIRTVKRFIDIIALDIKLPSLCGGGDFFPIYSEVLREISAKKFFCKVVVSSSVDLNEFKESVLLVSRFDRSIPFIIQPATLLTDNGGSDMRLDVDPDLMIKFYDDASKYLDNVKLIPQCHRLLGIL
ncbi:MAG TPA: 7-carboxy-7-deazaguanine synthase QueE [Candidatus Krumholzibacteriaceae bacterium]|nr:7-carboxy-7-deazaguanine synthase QueE [Candidatus Krumholzibacteriaceae bacterium]